MTDLAEMSALLDTNVVLDAMLLRSPWVTQAEPIWRAGEQGRLSLYISASSLTDIYYVSRKLRGKAAAREILRLCLERLSILTVEATTLRDAFALPISDFEDALQVACAARGGVDAIVTRDPGGFAASPVPVFSPASFLDFLDSRKLPTGRLEGDA